MTTSLQEFEKKKCEEFEKKVKPIVGDVYGREDITQFCELFLLTALAEQKELIKEWAKKRSEEIEHTDVVYGYRLALQDLLEWMGEKRISKSI